MFCQEIAGFASDISKGKEIIYQVRSLSFAVFYCVS